MTTIKKVESHEKARDSIKELGEENFDGFNFDINPNPEEKEDAFESWYKEILEAEEEQRSLKDQNP